MKVIINWHWGPEYNQYIIAMSTNTIAHTCIYVSVVSHVANISRSFSNMNKLRV